MWHHNCVYEGIYIYTGMYTQCICIFLDGIEVRKCSGVAGCSCHCQGRVTLALCGSTCLLSKIDVFFFPPSLSHTLSFLFVAYHAPCLARLHVWAAGVCMCVLFSGWEVCCCVRFSPGCVHTTEFWLKETFSSSCGSVAAPPITFRKDASFRLNKKNALRFSSARDPTGAT